MSEAIIGGLIGGPLGALIALMGTYLVIRDGRRGRIAGREEKASEDLLELVKLVRADSRYLHDKDQRFNWSEDTAAAVLAFRDPRVRERLQQSLQMLVLAQHLATVIGRDEAERIVQRVALKDLYECLGRRLDGTRLPKAEEAWELANKDLGAFMAAAIARIDEARADAPPATH